MRKDVGKVTEKFNNGPLPKAHRTVMAGAPIVRRGKKSSK